MNVTTSPSWNLIICMFLHTMNLLNIAFLEYSCKRTTWYSKPRFSFEFKGLKFDRTRDQCRALIFKIGTYLKMQASNELCRKTTYLFYLPCQKYEMQFQILMGCFLASSKISKCDACNISYATIFMTIMKLHKLFYVSENYIVIS